MASFQFHPLYLLVFAVEAPRAIANRLGFFTKEFAVRDKRIVRPEAFASRAHRFAFQTIGDFLLNPSDPDRLARLTDSEILKDERYRACPLPVWHEALAFFEREGFIVKYWRMVLSTIGDCVGSPSWDADGNAIPKPENMRYRYDPFPGELPFWPGLLTEEQMRGLLGTSYVSQRSFADVVPEERVILSPAHFERIYYRAPGLLDDERR